ncbi:MAG: S1 family peptidase [Methyloceanibacter sp.]
MMRVRSFAASLGVALALFLSVSGLARSDDNEMIVAGTEAPDGKFPYQVRLYTSMDDDRGFCGGSIIAPQWVLTASHCVTRGDLDGGPTSQADPEDVVVGYGSNDRTKTTKVEAEKIFVRPEFLEKGLNGKADVALIKLAAPIADAKPVPLADPEIDEKYLVPGARVTVSGWGTLWSFDEDFTALMSDLGPEIEGKVEAPIRLREVDMDWIDNDSCNAAFVGSHGTGVAPTELCAYQRGTNKDTCQGDSGGPMVVRDEGGAFVQIGVVSWGSGCGGTTPGVYARVAPFAGWIADTIKSN